MRGIARAPLRRLTAARPPSAPRPLRCAASAAPVSSSGKRWVMSSIGCTAPRASSASAARMSAGPADQLAVTSSSRMNTRVAVDAPAGCRAAAARRRRARRPARAPRRRRRSRPSAACRRSPRRRARCRGRSRPSARRARAGPGCGSRTHTASTPVACAAAMCSSPLQPAPTTSTRVAGRHARAALGAQGAGERLGEGGEHRVHAVEREQLADELGLDAHVLGEAAGVEPGGAEALAQRLVPAAAAAALAARRVVVDRDPVADRDAVDARADLDHLAGRLVAEHRGELAADVERLHVGAAGRAGEHAADDLAGAGDGVGRLLDDRLVLGQRAGDPHATSATVSAFTGRATPLLGHQRPHQLGGRDVERRVAARRPLDRQQRAAGAAHLVGRRAPRSRSRRRRPARGRPRTTARRPRTGSPPRPPPARGRRCRPCWRRRRWPPRGRSR